MIRNISCVGGDTIEIGADIRINVIAIDGDEVVLEIESPDDLAVKWWEELVAGSI